MIDPTTARKRGRVVDVLIDPTIGRLAGMLIALAGEAAPEQISAKMIARIGADAVILRSKVNQDTPEVRANRESYLDYSSLVGLQVLDEAGNQVGHIHDAKIDPDDLAITAYALVDTSWRHWLGLQSEIGPTEVTSWSRELMLIKPRGPGAANTAVTVVGQPQQLPDEPAGPLADVPQNLESQGDVHAPDQTAGTDASGSRTRRRRSAIRGVSADRDQGS